MAVIVLIQQFLSGVLGDGQGLSASLAMRLGPEVALWGVALLLVITYVLSSFLTYDSQVTEQRIVKALELGVMARLIRHLLSLSVEFFEVNSHGDLVQAMRQDVSRLREVLRSYAALVLEGSMIMGLTAAAFWISPRLTFWVLVLLPAISLPLVIAARRTLRRSYMVRREGYVLFDMILQMLRGIRVIKVYQGQEGEAQSVVRRASGYFDQLIEVVRIQSLGRLALDSMAGLTIVAVVIAGGSQVLGGNLAWPSLLAFLLAVRSLHGPLNNFNTNYLQIQRSGASLARISELLAEAPSVRDAPEARSLRHPPGRIEFQNVSFSRQDNLVLSNVSFQVEAGQTIGIAGPSGAGKTSLLNLVARFFDPDEGAILLDGSDLCSFRQQDWYAEISLVTQPPFLFSSSVRDNIRCGRPEAGDDEIEAAATAAMIHDEISALENGYDTLLGLGGRGLSEGQAQRINVARALLKNAPVLLLDEATSSLDSIAESQLQKAVDSLVQNRTTFVVAHRLSTLRNADKIIVLEAGRMVGMGTHQALVDSCGLYREMWETQQ